MKQFIRLIARRPLTYRKRLIVPGTVFDADVPVAVDFIRQKLAEHAARPRRIAA